MLFVQYDQGQLNTCCMKLVLQRPVIRQMSLLQANEV